MAGLGDVVRALAERDAVASVVLLSADGLPIHHAGREVDADAIAALTATMVRDANLLADTLARGALGTMVLVSDRGLAIVARVGADWLVVLPVDGAEVGALLYDLRRHRSALTALL